MKTETDVAQPLIFTPISLLHAEQVESIRRTYGNTLYVYTFASLFAWQDDEKYEICLCDDAFIIKNAAEGENAYLFPCGSDAKKKELIDSLISSESPVFCSLTDEDKFFLEKEYPNKFVFEECRDEFTYLYDKKAQIELKGKEYKRLRKKINRGRNAAAKWVTEPITDTNIQRALDINSLWSKAQASTGLADVHAAEVALRNFSQLKMHGLIFKADGKDVAYIAGAFVTSEIFDLSFCKVLNKHCDYYVKWEFYCSLPGEITTVDSEEDLGIEGLRNHKIERVPKELVRVWKGSFNK